MTQNGGDALDFVTQLEVSTGSENGKKGVIHGDIQCGGSASGQATGPLE